MKRGPKPYLTFEMYVHDVQCVAKRLNIQHVSAGLYDEEGSFWRHALHRTLHRRWDEVCAAAGLLRPRYGPRFGSIGPCAQCGQPYRVPVNKNRHACRLCRAKFRKRQGELF